MRRSRLICRSGVDVVPGQRGQRGPHFCLYLRQTSHVGAALFLRPALLADPCASATVAEVLPAASGRCSGASLMPTLHRKIARLTEKAREAAPGLG